MSATECLAIFTTTNTVNNLTLKIQYFHISVALQHQHHSADVWCWGALSITITCILPLSLSTTNISALIKTLHCVLPTDQLWLLKFYQDSWSPDWDSNPGTPKYKGALTIQNIVIHSCTVSWQLMGFKCRVSLHSQYLTSSCNN